MNLPPFYVGQRVVALNTGITLVKNKVYTITGIYPSDCGCQGWDVTVGLLTNQTTHRCDVCGRQGLINRTNQRLYLHSLFAPIEETFQAITLEKVLENETPLVSAN